VLIAAVVAARPLQLQGARYNVGEGIMLDPTNAQHREVLDSGWALPVPATAAVVAPPAHKMVVSAAAKSLAPAPPRGKS